MPSEKGKERVEKKAVRDYQKKKEDGNNIIEEEGGANYEITQDFPFFSG